MPISASALHCLGRGGQLMNASQLMHAVRLLSEAFKAWRRCQVASSLGSGAAGMGQCVCSLALPTIQIVDDTFTFTRQMPASSIQAARRASINDQRSLSIAAHTLKKKPTEPHQGLPACRCTAPAHSLRCCGQCARLQSAPQ
jgi:hypothetical protein